MAKTCKNCVFSRKEIGGGIHDYECHRHAPKPHNALRFYELELLRELAWAGHISAQLEKPDDHDELNVEATEASHYAVWPEVQSDDWCGEWKGKR